MPATYLQKTILRDGEYLSGDGVVKVTPARRKHWAETFQKMSAEDAKIPVGWDHDPDEGNLVPLSDEEFESRRKRSAMDTVGRLVSVRDVGNATEIAVELTDPKAIGRAERNEVFVSPVLVPAWTNSRGTTFTDCIGHMDLVNHPVDHSQGPFREPSNVIACSLIRMSNAPTQIYKVTRMAKDDDGRTIEGFYTDDYGVTHPITSGGSKKKSRGKKERSGRMKKKKRMSLIRMGDKPFGEDDDKEKDNKPGESGDVPPADESAEPAEKTKIDELVTGSVDDVLPDIVDGILELLEACCDIVLPEDTTDDNLLDRLNVALHTALAMKNKSEAKSNEANADDDEDDDKLQVAESSMQTMSLQAKNALAFATNVHREQVNRELEQLAADGRCTPNELKQRQSALKVTKLSLSDQGVPKKGDIEKWIESRKACPKGTFWDSKQKLSLLAPVDPPTSVDGKLTDSDIQKAVDWATGKTKQPA